MKKQEGKIYRTPENPTLVCMRWVFFFNGKKNKEAGMLRNLLFSRPAACKNNWSNEIDYESNTKHEHAYS